MYRAVILIAAVALVVGCQPQKSPAEQMAEKNKAIVSQVYQYFNADDWDKVATVTAADFIDHNPEPDQKPGFEGVKEAFKIRRTAFPDMKLEPLQLVAEGDLVCAHVIVSGTQKGDFMGMAATGKSFKIEGYDLLRLANGKAVERWGVFDMAGLMMQLGMMPAPGEAPPQQKDVKKK